MRYTDVLQLPQNYYEVILIDPPWSYNDKMNSGKRGASHKYETMSDTDIYKLPINDILATNATVFVWSTPPKIDSALCAISCWGLTYKTYAFNWIKLNSKALTPFMGCGSYTRSNTETVLLATKGKPKRVSRGVRMLVEDWTEETLRTPIREHSRKPDEIRDRITELMGDVPRLEMFARQESPGWDCFGNELDKFTCQSE